MVDEPRDEEPPSYDGEDGTAGAAPVDGAGPHGRPGPPSLDAFADTITDGLGFYDRHGNPIDWQRHSILKWGTTPRVDVVAKTWHGDVEVSTCWLGWDMRYSRSGPPLIFETMIFGADDETWCRYSTEDQAMLGHRLAVGWLRLARPLPALPAGPQARTT